jgi:hypothetical protein
MTHSKTAHHLCSEASQNLGRPKGAYCRTWPEVMRESKNFCISMERILTLNFDIAKWSFAASEASLIAATREC